MSESGDDDRIEDALSTPDLAHEFLAHLRVNIDDFGLHAQAYREAPTEDGRNRLSDDLHRFRNTLVLLEKEAAVFVVEELLALLQTSRDGQLSDVAQQARVLSAAAQDLKAYVVLLHQDAALDSALSLLPLVNDTRACRGESLFSDVLLLAAGIELPVAAAELQAGHASEQSSTEDTGQSWSQQRQSWSDHVSARHGALAQSLLAWWAGLPETADRLALLKPVAVKLDGLAGFCQRFRYLEKLQPLFQAAALVARCIGSGELRDGPALRSLYAQLERHLYQGSRPDSPEDLLPGDLLRNFLYYVAQLQCEGQAVNDLRQRFRLDRVRQEMPASASRTTPTIGVGYHLARAIGATIAAETDALRARLEHPHDAQSVPAQDWHARLIRLRVRLAQLEPVLTLMGAKEALVCLQSINGVLKDEPVEYSDEIRRHLPESLVQLVALLDQTARNSVKRSATPVAPSMLRPDDVYVDMAVDACLREARLYVRGIADALAQMLNEGSSSTGRSHAITRQLQQVDQALQILPLPEVTPLLGGLADLLAQLQLHGRQTPSSAIGSATQIRGLRSAIDELLESIDRYLADVLQPQASPNQYLADAEEALSQARSWIARLDKSSLDLTETRVQTLNLDEEPVSDVEPRPAVDAPDATLHKVFCHESIEHVDALESSVKSALQPSTSMSLRLPTEQMLRALHSLAVSAQAIDADTVLAIVQPLQRAALVRQRQNATFDAAETRFIGELLAALRTRLSALETASPVPADTLAVEQRIGDFLSAIIPGSGGQDSGLGLASNVRSLDDVFIEEANELLERLRLITQGPLVGPEESRAALSVLHTLKGSARMAGRVSIADRVHTLEGEVQALQRTRQDSAPEAAELTDTLQAGYRELHTLVARANAQLSISDDRDGVSAVPLPNLPGDTLQVSDSAFAALLDLATDVSINQARLGDELARLRDIDRDVRSIAVRWRALSPSENLVSSPTPTEMLADLDAARAAMREVLLQAEREQQRASQAAASLQQHLIRTRLVRVDEMSDRLARALLDAASSIHRQARLTIVGGETTLDRVLFKQLLGPLEHLTRNAVVHGIEPTELRLAAGKPPTGQVRLMASIDATDLILHIDDDGCGIDRDALNRLLEARGEPIAETHEELQNVLFRSGFSSIETPTALAGHGLGLAAVQSAMTQLGGRVQLSSASGEGTCISLTIPQRMVVTQVVLVEDAARLFAIPVSHVEAVHMPDSPATSEQSGTATRRIPLSRLLGDAMMKSRRVPTPVRASVLVNAAGEQLELEIDQVIGYRELVTQALGPQLASLRRYAGGSVLSDGRQVLVLDLAHALETAGSKQAGMARPARESLRPVALVVDDSLTMRTAAAAMLQQCGIAARQSRDGFEALESVAIAMPDLILLDIEMPRLDGVGFLKRLRTRFGDSVPPVIVVSTRSDQTIRDQLRQLGAKHFLIKPYDETQLHTAVKAAGMRLPDITIA